MTHEIDDAYNEFLVLLVNSHQSEAKELVAKVVVDESESSKAGTSEKAEVMEQDSGENASSGDYTIQLVSANPYPKDGETIGAGDYVVGLKVTKN